MRENITEELIDWLRKREEIGYKKYGGPLLTFSGRRLEVEALEEALDLIQYLFGFMLEREKLLYKAKTNSRPLRVYVAGPYNGNGSIEARSRNTERAIDEATKLLDTGHSLYVPHLAHFWDLRHQRSPSVWLALDLSWLAQCEAMIRLPGDSPGADEEERFARSIGIPVYESVEAFLDHQQKA